MKKWVHKLEVFVDKIIPLMLVILLGIIVVEVGFHEFALKYLIILEVLDGLVILTFVLDLIFKYLRIRNIPKFLRASWIDIIAIFPFFLVFRLFEGVIGLFVAGETITRTQQVVHLGVEVEKEVGVALKEGEVVAKEASRAERFSKFLRPLARSFRFFKFGDAETRKEAEKQGKELLKVTDKGIGIAIKQAENEGKMLAGDAKAIASETKKETNLLLKEGTKTIDEVAKVSKRVKVALFYEKPKIMKHVNEKLNKDKVQVKKR